MQKFKSKLEERFQPESHGVLVRNSDKQCTQIRIETDQVFCFETDFVDEETMTLVDTERAKPVSLNKEPYVTLFLTGALKFAPINDTQKTLPAVNAPPPPIPFDFNNLLTIFNRGFIICTRILDMCYHWPFHENEWHSFPPPNERHEMGAIGLLGNQLIMIGGKNNDGEPTDICELFDPHTYSWSDGPKLPVALGYFTLVQVSSTTILIVGGYNNTPKSDTYLLSKGDNQWTKLEDRPEPVYHSCCGVVILGDGRRGALSVGGNGNEFSTQAYFLDFELMTWSHMPSFTLPAPSYKGFLFQRDTEIHFLPLCEVNFDTFVLKHYVWKIHGFNQTWESRPYPFGKFTALNVGNPLTPTIYTMSIN
ncbi:uncharacterized protein LOC131891933 isoform X4 [Tigriopus californicus]|uniref:uncharacterized protein LOC131891933 isoform X4 n=1 Tax=Tigriopus californicus TaxID=6832 RepID=UPI0027DA158E|nr:uncharacterized protein LOC131891933 isoform X4 [Tigriopus californicus]